MIRSRKHAAPAADPIDSPAATRRSARQVRFQAHIPRLAFYAVVVILALAGLNATFGAQAEPAAPRTAGPPPPDLGAQSFAETFTRAYLTWHAGAPDERELRLAAFLPDSSDPGAGLDPPSDEDQSVEWTAVAGAQASAGRTLVTVAAHTDHGLTYLSVPVDRDRRGFLYVAGHPAVVGPPATNHTAPEEQPVPVEDVQLQAVVKRALTNYLGRADANLRADLTPDAVVSLPVEPLQVTSVDTFNWVSLDRRLAAEVKARDERGTTFELRYELDVRKRGRWFVQSLEVNPTFEGGK